jgi:hypothetical protein
MEGTFNGVRSVFWLSSAVVEGADVRSAPLIVVSPAKDPPFTPAAREGVRSGTEAEVGIAEAAGERVGELAAAAAAASPAGSATTELRDAHDGSAKPLAVEER